MATPGAWLQAYINKMSAHIIIQYRVCVQCFMRTWNACRFRCLQRLQRRRYAVILICCRNRRRYSCDANVSAPIGQPSAASSEALNTSSPAY